MKKEDFSIGQTVYLLSNDLSLKSAVVAGIVTKIDEAYISVSYSVIDDDVLFGIKDDFKQDTYPEEFILFLTADEAFDYRLKMDHIEYIRGFFKIDALAEAMPKDALQSIAEIISLYDPDVEEV